MIRTKTRYILFIMAFSLTCCRGTPTKQEQANLPIPLQLNGEAVGCGFFIVYKGTQDKTKSVMVRGEYGKVTPTKAPQTFAIDQTPGLEVYLDDYGEGKYAELCGPPGPWNPIVEHIQAMSGKVTTFITREKIKGSLYARAFAITVILEDVTFPASNGKSYYIDKSEIEDVAVGRPID